MLPTKNMEWEDERLKSASEPNTALVHVLLVASVETMPAMVRSIDMNR